MNNQPLRSEFSFDDDDLSTNRNGILSQKQHERLLQRAKTQKTMGLGCGLALLVMAILPTLLAAIMGSVFGAFGRLFTILWAVIWIPIWGIFALIVLIAAFRKRQYILQSVQGPINIIAVERRSSGRSHHRYIAHELYVGEQKFDVSADLGNYMMQGDKYSVYYIKGSNEIMSLERMA